MTTTLDTPPITTLLGGDPSLFRENFNRKAFKFPHNLADHPLLRLEHLLGYAKQTQESRPEDIYFDAGDIAVNQRWDATPASEFSVQEALERIENAKAWFIFRHANKDPQYGALVDKCMAEIGRMSSVDLSRLMKLQDAIIFVSSPSRITSYHIDRECNYLLQIKGTKTVYVFDQTDREILPEEELELFWSVDNNAAVYKEAFQDRAQEFILRPGEGVHIPVNAPHWIRNGNEVSVSLSVNFHFHDWERQHIYRMNYRLRRMGLKPTPPFQSQVKDLMKRRAFASAEAARKLLRGG